MKCPICDHELIISKYTDLIYHCHNMKDPNKEPYHYSCHVRQVEDTLVKSQEDFQYDNYIILKVIDIWTSQPENYLVAEDWENHGWRWVFEWSPEEFDKFFPDFNPKDLDTIYNKFNILNTFS